MKRIGAVVASCLALAAGEGLASAQQITGTLAADLTLTRACVINGSGTVVGVNFGLLSFGTQPATFVGPLTAQANTSGSATQVLCSADVTAINVIVGSGLHAGQGAAVGDGPRALRLGATASYVPYEVYATAGFASPYPTTSTGVSVNISPVGAPFALPIYGRINKTSPNALAAGQYVDTLTVTVEF
jgi:spore coat protein U-like protein